MNELTASFRIFTPSAHRFFALRAATSSFAHTMFGRRQSAVQQLIESAQLDSPVDIPSLLRGSYDDELDLEHGVSEREEPVPKSGRG